MELRAFAGFQQRARQDDRLWRTYVGAPARSCIVARRPGQLYLWKTFGREARTEGRREARGGAVVLRCRREERWGGEGAKAEALTSSKASESIRSMHPNDGLLKSGDAGVVDRSCYVGPEDKALLDDGLDFWDYEATRHTEELMLSDVAIEGLEGEGIENQMSAEESGSFNDAATGFVRPEFVVPKVKFRREKPKYRVFSAGRQQYPRPRINRYGVLMKMIDPANDDEYLDSGTSWRSRRNLKHPSSVPYELDLYSKAESKQVYDNTDSFEGGHEGGAELSREECTSYESESDDTEEVSVPDSVDLDPEQYGDSGRDWGDEMGAENGPRFDIGKDLGCDLKWDTVNKNTATRFFSDKIDGIADRKSGSVDKGISGPVGSSRICVTSDIRKSVPIHQQGHSTAKGGCERKIQLAYALSDTDDSVDDENELVTDNDDDFVNTLETWSDFDDEDSHINDDELVIELGSMPLKDDTAECDDPLRRFLSSRTGNRDSKQEGRVYKFNKAARKSAYLEEKVNATFYDSKTFFSKSTVIGNELLSPALDVKERGHMVFRVDTQEAKNHLNGDNVARMHGRENRTHTSSIREVLQIAHNLPKTRLLEDYMAPYLNKFTNIQANLILEAMCESDMTDQVLSFFRWMRLHEPCLWDSRSFSLVFIFLGKMGMPDQSLTYFRILPQEEHFHSVHVYNTLITCLTNCNRHSEVPFLLEEMQKWGTEPDSVTFSILMSSANKGGRSLKDVWSLFQGMVERGVQPSVTLFGTLIKAFCDAGCFKEALLITTEMEKIKVPSSVVIYNILIDAYGKAGQLEEAEGLISEMKEKGLQPNVGTYNALISSYLESKPKRQFTVAEDLIEEMQTLGLKPDVVTFTSLVGAYGHEGRTEEAAQVFKRMQATGVHPNSYSYTALIHAYSAGGWPEKAAQAFEMMRKQGISATPETFTALMDAYRRIGDLEMVNIVWKSMKMEGCVATRVTYMTILDAFQKQGRFKEARDIIEEFKNLGHEPDLMVYNMLLNAYGRGGRHEKMPKILLEMKAAGIEPDSFTYCTLIYGFLRVRDHTKALKYHREMRNKGKLPDAKTYAKVRAILKVVEERRDENNLKGQRGRLKTTKANSEKAKYYWKRRRPSFRQAA